VLAAAGLDWSHSDEETTVKAIKAMTRCRSPFKCDVLPITLRAAPLLAVLSFLLRWNDYTQDLLALVTACC